MRSLALIFLLFLASCSSLKMTPGPELDTCVCETWKTPWDSNDAVLPALDPCWWQTYQDPCLNQLETQALQNNFDLKIAAARVLQARALVCRAFSDRLPSLNLNPTYSRESMLVTLEDFGLGSRKVRIEERQIIFPLAISYEIDFWGKYRLLEAAAQERFLASVYNQAAIEISLTAEVATLYFHLRTLDEEIHYLQQAVQVREDYLSINRERLRCGLDSEMDVTRASLDLALAQSDLEDARRLRGQTENALAILLGYPACSFTLEPGQLPTTNLIPPPELPSLLVSRRPDIQQKMHAAIAVLQEIGVAKRDFFPQFSLTGAIGLASPSFGSLFTWQSRFWALAVEALQVVFDGGRLASKLAFRKAEYTETIAEYQKQVVSAFQEVEDALNEVHYRKNQVQVLEQAVLFSQDTALLARNQYDSGLINYLLVADAEKTQLDTRRAFIRVHGSLYMASIQLIKSLGGGFH